MGFGHVPPITSLATHHRLELWSDAFGVRLSTQLTSPAVPPERIGRAGMFAYIDQEYKALSPSPSW